MDKNTIRVATKVIIHAGNARTLISAALKNAEEGKFDEAEKLLAEAEQEINAAHHTQTETIQAEARGEGVDMSLLLTHAQDTLMSALSEMHLASHLLSMYRKFSKRLDEISGA